MGIFPQRGALLILLLAAQPHAQAFRNCEQAQDTAAFRGSSAYTVSEIEFDAASRHATGTVTHYNYSNAGSGMRECHVTYELSGLFEQSSTLFLLEANRSNLSPGCDGEFIDARFPSYRAYALQVNRANEQEAVVLRADNGDSVANTEWQDGYITYKTAEVCELL